MRVLVLAEYYPRAGDPSLGVWAHRQTVAARDAGAEVRVLVLHRPLPPLAAVRQLDLRAARAAVGQPASATLDGVEVEYLRFLSPPRPWSYARWGAWAAPPLRRALRRIRARFSFDLIHAHYAVPAGDAVRRAAPAAPLVISVHGGDVLGAHASAPAVQAALGHARIVFANSAGIARRCDAAGARDVRVLHLGTDPPPMAATPPEVPTVVTVGNLIARKRHADVIEAVSRLRGRWPGLRYEIVGDGPERQALEALVAARGLGDRVRFTGRLAPADAVATARRATVFAMPSVAEAFGVAYIEAMAAGVPAIGCAGEDGPEEIAAAGGGIELVAPGDVDRLTAAIAGLLGDRVRRDRLAAEARATVLDSFTWERCGAETVTLYEEAMRG